MPLRLKIENETSLPDGGPISYTLSGKRGMDIGRDQYLDWVLPDPTRVVSGKHCEIRFRDGAYWLQDVSTNGTFINNSEQRVQGIHLLQNGDRVEIGRYIISVSIDGEEGGGQAAGGPTQEAYPDSAAVWQVGGEVPPPINPRELKAPKVDLGMRSLDVLDWASDIPVLPPDPLPSAQPSYPPPPMPTRPLPAVNASAWDSDPVAAPLPARAEPLMAAPASAPAATDWLVESVPNEPDLASPAPAPVAPTPVVEASPPAAEPIVPVSPSPTPVQERPAAERPRLPPASPLSNDSELIRRFAAAAGIPEAVIAARDAGTLLEQLGVLMKSTVENLQQLQSARAQSKGIMRSANQTLIQATDNNPLRFSPNPTDALKIMFGPPTPSYLDANRAIESSFNDLKKHQLTTFTAMQEALKDLFDELDPKNVTNAAGDARGLSVMGSKKARFWDLFVTRWEAKVGKHERGMLGVFMQIFAEAYDKHQRGS